VVGSYKHCNEPSGFIKGTIFLEDLNDLASQEGLSCKWLVIIDLGLLKLNLK
jgi:hypothetical protein